MAITLGITIGDRIKFAERLPEYGSLEYIKKIRSIKNKLIGFANAQLISYRIISYNGKLMTANPNTSTTITLDDNDIKAYATYIQRKNVYNGIEIDEADFYQKILDAYDEIVKAEQELSINEADQTPDSEQE